MRHALRHLTVFVWILASGLFAARPADAQCVSLTTLGAASTQSFDTLSNTAGSTTNNLTITGWFMTETGGGARDNEQYAVDTGGSNTGDTYSYGAAAATDRALGGLRSGTLVPLFGACFTNNTGSTVTSLNIAYTGEQWRLGTAARTDQINFEYSLNATDLVTGTWNAVAALNFVTPSTATTGAKDGNAAANRTALSSTVPALSIANGATFWIRWTDTDASNADDGLAVDEFSLTPQGGIVTPTLNVGDAAVTEGNAGTVTATFTVSLTAPAGPGGVTFDIATADNTATDADNDYEPQSLTGQTIPAGSSTYAFNVTVNGDPTPEPNETFFVNVSNITGANAGDVQGTGTINNDDVALTPIHDIQGPGNSSPIVGSTVTTRGIVTGIKTNGFFIQEPDASVDADPATSEGILIFTGGAPPAAATLGALVQVTGTVAEFVPAQDPFQPPLTELTAPTVLQISTGNPLPAPVALTASFPDPAGPFDQLERLEGMRVSVASFTVTGPTLGNVNEANATATSSGVFFGTVTGVPRPFREPGIQAPNPAPAGTIPPIPRWDSNPELIRVDSDGQVGGTILDVGFTTVVTGLVGPLDYSFRRYTIQPDPASPLAAAGGPTPIPATPATAREFTVAAYNLERFFDTVNDPGIGEPVLTAAAFDNRLNKASRAIRNFLRTPDILGVIEVENLTTLQALAARISSDAIAASQPDPQYMSFLVEGNDVGGIDVGFLVKTAPVVGSTPRVTVNAVVQEKAGELFVNPDSSTELLNDRPSLRLDAVVNHANGATYPVTVIVNHLRSLNGVEDPGPGSNGWATAGARVRAKRQAQADSVADLVQARQTANPNERIILVGDFNAFEFNDGLGDSMGTIEGTPSPDNETAVPGDGVDLVNPDLDNLFDTAPPAERYSFIFDGHAQSLDHVVVNEDVITSTLARRVEHPRINADFPEVARNNTTDALRLADHDPVVSFYEVAGFLTADLSIAKEDTPDPVIAGTNLTYTITVTNNGPDPAVNASWSDTLPAGTTFVSLPAVAGWSCSTGATVSCSNPSFAVGSAVFTLTVAVDPSLAAGTVLSNTATVTSTTADGTPGNNSATATTTVGASADLSITKEDNPDPVTPGTNLTYTITVSNQGPSTAAGVSWSDTLPAGTTFVSLIAEAGWNCTNPAPDAGGTVTCSLASFPVGTAGFTLTVAVAPSATGTISNTATVTSSTPDGEQGNESATAITKVGVVADLVVTKVDTPDPVAAGGSLTYTITLTNNGPSNAEFVSLEDELPAGTTFQSLTAPAGWSCTTPAVGGTGFVTCSSDLLAPGSATFTLVVQVDLGVTPGTVLTNTATASSETPEGNQGDESGTATTTVVAAGASLSITKTDNPDPVNAGANLTYTITVGNAGPGNAPNLSLSDPLPAGTTFQSLAAPAGWSCTTPAVGAGGTVTCTNPSFSPGNGVFTLVVNVDASVAAGTVLLNTATVEETNPQKGEQGGLSASTETTVIAPANLSATKAVSGTFAPGGTVTYSIVLTNSGPSTQGDYAGDELTDVLPAELTLVSATATSGTAVADLGANTVTWNGPLAAGASVTITIQATIDADVAPGTTITNQATFRFDADGNGASEATGVSDDTSVAGPDDPTPFIVGGKEPPPTEIPTLDTVGLALLAALLALGGAMLLRRRRA